MNIQGRIARLIFQLFFCLLALTKSLVVCGSGRQQEIQIFGIRAIPVDAFQTNSNYDGAASGTCSAAGSRIVLYLFGDGLLQIHDVALTENRFVCNNGAQLLKPDVLRVKNDNRIAMLFSLPEDSEGMFHLCLTHKEEVAAAAALAEAALRKQQDDAQSSREKQCPLPVGFLHSGSGLKHSLKSQFSYQQEKPQMETKVYSLPKDWNYDKLNYCSSASVNQKDAGDNRLFENETQDDLQLLSRHQGVKPYKTLCVKKMAPQASPLDIEVIRTIPVALQFLLIGCMLLLSGLFSGLNLGLMSLDTTELRIILNCGSPIEKQYARMIYPVRETGNYLLCSILFGNVIVNSGISILLGDLTSGMAALILSSLGIVSFGEILPQSLCSRFGLAVGAKTLWITKLFMVLTAPLSWPTSKLLDLIFGVEVGHSYNRERLLELIKLVKETEQDVRSCQEVDIVTGALEMSQKTVASVMTDINAVFMVPIDATLDRFLVQSIVASGYTRIPVFEGTRNNVVALLNVKDLALIDADDRIPVVTICRFYNHQLRFVLSDMPLNLMLEEFKTGAYHMAFVKSIVTNENDGDPFYQLIGVVTLEDIIEEILQTEIVDETDVYTDNTHKRIRHQGAQIKVKASLFLRAYRSMLSKSKTRQHQHQKLSFDSRPIIPTIRVTESHFDDDVTPSNILALNRALLGPAGKLSADDSLRDISMLYPEAAGRFEKGRSISGSCPNLAATSEFDMFLNQMERIPRTLSWRCRHDTGPS